jgi:hypothetical protein
MSDKLKEALEKLMPAYPSKTRAAGVSMTKVREPSARSVR